MSKIEKYSQQTFDDIKYFTEDGVEFWYGRELQRVLEYSKWDNFKRVIEKAKVACSKTTSMYWTILLTLGIWFNLVLVPKEK